MRKDVYKRQRLHSAAEHLHCLSVSTHLLVRFPYPLYLSCCYVFSANDCDEQKSQILERLQNALSKRAAATVIMQRISKT